MLFLSESDVRRLLPMRDAIGFLRTGFEAWAANQAQNQPRRRLILPTGAVLHSMAGACGRYFGTKIYSTHARHGAHFLFLLYDAETAQPLALFEANWLGQIRTGAATGLATDLLARADASTLALIGTGFQARSQMEAVLAVRTIQEVRVWSRKAENRGAFVREYEGSGTRVVEAGSAEDAVRGADIVVTMTNARDPVIEASCIAPGTHVNAAGSNVATRRELPSALVESAALIVADSVEQAHIEAGDLLLALGTGDWGDRVVELRSLPRRTSPDAVTIFKSVGLGLEDVAVAGPVYERAVREGVGKLL